MYIEIVIWWAYVDVSFAIPAQNVVTAGQWTGHENVSNSRRIDTGGHVNIRLRQCKQGTCDQ